jgi:hypothetical protein
MSKYKKKYKKYKLSGKCKDSNLKQMKANIQKEQRTAYWQYIEKMICNIPIDDDKTPTSSKFPKNLFSYIKSQKSESSNIATLRQNGHLYFFLYFDIFIFISLVIHGRFFRCLSIF